MLALRTEILAHINERNEAGAFPVTPQRLVHDDRAVHEELAHLARQHEGNACRQDGGEDLVDLERVHRQRRPWQQTAGDGKWAAEGTRGRVFAYGGTDASGTLTFNDEANLPDNKTAGFTDWIAYDQRHSTHNNPTDSDLPAPVPSGEAQWLAGMFDDRASLGAAAPVASLVVVALSQPRAPVFRPAALNSPLGRIERSELDEYFSAIGERDQNGVWEEAAQDDNENWWSWRYWWDRLTLR